jgi:hypothetical protein
MYAKSKRSTLRLFQQMVPESYFSGMDGMLRTLIDQRPVRVVWGGGDPYIPARYAYPFPGASVEINEHGGHWIPVSAAPLVADAVTSILSSVPAVPV